MPMIELMSRALHLASSGRVVATAVIGALLGALSPAARAHPAAEVVQVRDPGPEKVALTPSVVIPGEDAGYMLVLPNGRARGLVVTFASGRDTSSAGYEMHLYQPCLSNGLAFAFVTTGNRLDFFFEDSTIARADDYVHDMLATHDIPPENLFLAGMSLAGTRALRYAIYCAKGRSAHGSMARAVAICDAPLDFVRFWRECQEAERLNAHPAAAAEGAWVSDHLEANLGGTPETRPIAYRDYSPYSYLAESGGNARHLVSVGLRAYTEPDVEWWLETRRKDYYAMNAVDAAAIVKTLLVLGNEEAELITTSGRGHHPDGTRHPHSWSIVDNEELATWFASFVRTDAAR